MTVAAPTDAYMRLEQVVAIVGGSTERLRKLCASGEMHGILEGNSWYTTLDEHNRYLLKKHAESESQQRGHVRETQDDRQMESPVHAVPKAQDNRPVVQDQGGSQVSSAPKAKRKRRRQARPELVEVD